MEPYALSIYEAADRIAAGALSPVTLTQSVLERVERLDPVLNTFITLTAETALVQARQADAAVQRRENRGPLHGIPIALKDLYETAGVRTTAGSVFWQDTIPREDAFTVKAFKDAGAVLLGKLNMHEIALGLTNENPHFGVCRNPWDTDRVPGGSSGGSGAALAAGLCLGSLGSDTGGSIRVPAALCGVVGLKPTTGRVSLRGVMPLSWHLDHAGPMARNVRDTALLFEAIAGYDPDDPYSLNIPVDKYTNELEAGVRGWRVALADGEYFRDVEEGIWPLIEAAADVFVDFGAQVSRVELPDFGEAALANTTMILSDAAALHQERLASRPADFGADVRERLEMGAAVSTDTYIQARRTQVLFRRKMENLLERFDLLLLPTTPQAAPLIQKGQAVQRARSLTRFTAPFNLSGLPAISVPCGFLKAGASRLPVGLQIVSRPWAEAALLRGAYAYEQAAGWYRERPPLD
jgi:aspartyl-tRNA(Asn)/glutamyl-tRNA(Gln) amidotransferase subunit A